MQLTQLTLGLDLQHEASFANFHPGPNHQIVASLKETASGHGEARVYLCGARGQGRSHLLQACCYHAHQHGLSSGYFPLANLISYSPDCLLGLENLDLLCIDDLERIAPFREWEEAVFHLFNRAYECGTRLILSAPDHPKFLHLQLPDLVSRLTWGIIYQLNSLSDDEKLEVLRMRAHLRGMRLSEEVGRYILTHCSRQLNQLLAALDDLDKASLATHRKLTIPFVKEVLLAHHESKVRVN